ncbi:hypothetical protein A0H81_02038 [Grifola frondosa]|uniref:Uncharacterized protein n=1 Tax=Grifola frondosa TaxID=5627 RepID=A0A1C7MLS7_GRIFR|nr:hypothetical protein A0H81_02038 [Grifola frondosa]
MHCTFLYSRAVSNENSYTGCSCLNWYRWQGWTGVVFFVVAEMILQLRLYALYCLNKRILVFMTVVCVAAAASSAAVMGFALSNATVTTSHIFPQKSFCVIFGMSDYFFAFWIPMIISEILSANSGNIDSRRDALLHLHVDRVCVEAIVFAVGQTNEVEIPITVASTISCVLTNRMCLNVRGMLQDESMAPYPVPLDSPGFEEELYSPVVYTVDGSALSAREMYELRSLRANRVSPVCFEHAGTMKPFFGGFSRRSGV